MSKCERLALVAFVALVGCVSPREEVARTLSEPQVVSGGLGLYESVYDRYFVDVCRRDRAADAAWGAVRTPEEARTLKSRLRQKMIAALGGLPARTPLNAQTTGSFAGDGYRIEKVLFESRPHHHVTAHLFLPDAARFRAPYPALVVPCGHSRSGKCLPAYQRPGVLGAKAGFAVLVYDPIDQGERRQKREVGNFEWSPTAEHNRLGLRAHLLGWNAAQFRIWDGMRAIDYVLSRADVDSARGVGVMGISGGGTLTSYLMALDDRVTAACPAAYLSTIRAVCEKSGPQDAEQNIFGQLAFGLNHLGYVGMAAPAAVLMNVTSTDFFPISGALETIDRAQRLYSVLGHPEDFSSFECAGPHHWYESERTASLRWMRAHLADDRSALPFNAAALRELDVGFSYAEADVGTADPSDPQRWVTEKGRVTPDGFTSHLPGERTVYDILNDELARLDARRGVVTPDVVRDISRIRPLDELKARALDVRESTLGGGVSVRRATLLTEDGIRIPTVAYRPASAIGVPVLLVSDVASREELAPRVRALLAEGRAVMVAEVRAFGETGAMRRGRSGFYGCSDEDEEIAVLMGWLGENLVSHRAEDILLAAREFSFWIGAKPEIIAEGRAAVPAAHAFYLERRMFAGLACERAPESWRSVLADPEKPYRFANLVFGALAAYDWTDLLEGASRPADGSTPDDGKAKKPSGKRPTEIMFWFDTENYTEEFAAEPIKDIANLLTEEGVRGHFCIVGYEAKKLVDWRRTDILDALKPHVIGSQSLYHTWHPNITESTDLEDFDAAYLQAAREEYESLGMIKAATGCERLLCSALPGNGNSIAAFYLYADMDIPFFGGGCGVYDDGKHAEVWYCNQRHRPYCPWMHLESFLPGKAPVDVEKKLDEMAEYEGLTLYMHPHMAVVKCHPDGLNWNKRNQTPFGRWIPCPHRDPADTKVYYERLRAFVRRIKSDPRFEITDCERLLAAQKPRRAITRADLPAIRDALAKDLGPVSRPGSWCVADCFRAVVEMLKGVDSYLPGKAYGFLYAPEGVGRETVVRRADVVAAARTMDVGRFLPHRVKVGGDVIGPADFLFAALEFLTTDAESVTLRPREQLGDIAAKLPTLSTFKCAGTWRYTPEFKDKWISNRLRWQFWTLRYE